MQPQIRFIANRTIFSSVETESCDRTASLRALPVQCWDMCCRIQVTTTRASSYLTLLWHRWPPCYPSCTMGRRTYTRGAMVFTLNLYIRDGLKLSLGPYLNSFGHSPSPVPYSSVIFQANFDKLGLNILILKWSVHETSDYSVLLFLTWNKVL